jgi:hypothetical protein
LVLARLRSQLTTSGSCTALLPATAMALQYSHGMRNLPIQRTCLDRAPEIPFSETVLYCEGTVRDREDYSEGYSGGYSGGTLTLYLCDDIGANLLRLVRSRKEQFSCRQRIERAEGEGGEKAEGPEGRRPRVPRGGLSGSKAPPEVFAKATRSSNFGPVRATALQTDPTASAGVLTPYRQVLTQ